MKVRIIILLAFVCQSFISSGQDKVSLLFIGDVMGHGPQIKSAYIDSLGIYDYHHCFKYIEPSIRSADVAIANLEVTLGGYPYQGYPHFSSPDTLVDALVDAGIDVLVTANNHILDRGKKGLNRTMNVLDAKGVPHTGAFRDSADRKKRNPLIIETKGFKLALLNYTYGTNGIEQEAPNIVNYIDTAVISKDISYTQSLGVDKIIVFVHWGLEYKLQAVSSQVLLKDFLWSQGIDVLIGSHPHVVEPVIWEKTPEHNRMVAYSLGNFISNQRTSPRDGGMMVMVTLEKDAETTAISDVSYQLTWVDTPEEDGKKKYYVMPARLYANDTVALSSSSIYQQNRYIAASGEVFANNVNVLESIYYRTIDKPLAPLVFDDTYFDEIFSDGELTVELENSTTELESSRYVQISEELQAKGRKRKKSK